MTKKESNPIKEYNPIERTKLIREEIQARQQNLQRAQQVVQQESANIVKLQGALEEATLATKKVKE